MMKLLSLLLPILLAGPAAGQELELLADLEPTGEPLVQESGAKLYGSNPSQIHRGPDGRAYFVAHDRLHGAEIWVTDGSSAGTALYIDVIPGEESSDPRFVGWLDELLFFSANRSEDVEGSEAQQLWRTDGTPEGTFPILDACPRYCDVRPFQWMRDYRPDGVVADGHFFFPARSDELGREIYYTDGTVEGTMLTRDRHFRGGDGVEGPLIAVGDRVVAVTSTAPAVEALSSVGIDGEFEIPVLCPDGSETVPTGADLFPVGEASSSRVAFVASCPAGDDAVTVPGKSQTRDRLTFDPGVGHLFATDGSSDAARELARADIGSVDVITSVYYDPLDYVVLPGGRTLFGVALPGEIHGVWITDGTPEGTLPVPDAGGLAREPFGRNLQRLGDRAVSQQSEGDVSILPALWLSDGTPHGISTISVEPLVPFVTGLTPAGRDHLVFWRAGIPEDDGPPEVLLSDGTAEGTRIVGRLHAGAQRVGWPQAVRVADRILIPGWMDREAGSELWSVEVPSASPCNEADLGSLCLHDGRFEIRLRHVDPGTGTEKLLWPAKASRGHEAGGLYWFFGPENQEVAVKLLDGRPINGHWWLFAGTLTELEFEIEVTDHLEGETKTWRRAGGDLCGLADVEAFPDQVRTGSIAQAVPRRTTGPNTAASPACPDGGLCLHEGRFALDVSWRVPATGESGSGVPVPFDDNDATGAFYFFGEENRELLVQILDGRPINDRWWVFWGAQTDLPLELRVRDLETGRSRVFTRDGGDLCGDRDLETFLDG